MLEVSSDANLGNASGDLIIHNGTLETIGGTAFSSGRSISSTRGYSGTIIFGNTTTTPDTLSGYIDSGDTTITFIDSGVVDLTGTIGSFSCLAIDEGNLVISGSIDSACNFAINNGATMTLPASVDPRSITLDGGTLDIPNSRSLSGSITLGTNGGVLSFGNNSIDITGAINGPGGIVLRGTPGDSEPSDDDTVAFSNNNNTYSGTTEIVAGTLLAGCTDALSPNSAMVVDSGALLQLDGNDKSIASLAGAGTVDFGGGFGNFTVGSDNTSTAFSGVIGKFENPEGFSTLTKVGSGTLSLGVFDASNSAQIIINGGALAATRLHANGASSIMINSGGALLAEGPYSTVEEWLASGLIDPASTGTLALTTDESSIDLSGLGGYKQLSIGAEGSVTIGGTITGAGSYTLGGGSGLLTVTAAISGDESIIIVGDVLLSGNNTSEGETEIEEGGTLQLGSGNALGSSDLVMNGGTLDMAGYSLTIPELNSEDDLSTITSSAGMATLQVTDGGVYQGSITSGFDGAVALQLNGGTLMLDGSGTQLSTLALNDSTLDLNDSNITVSALTGSGGTITYSSGRSPEVIVNGWGSSEFDGSIINAGLQLQSGQLTLGGSSTNINVDVEGGLLTLNNITALGTSGVNSTLIVNGGELDLNGFSATVSSLSGIGGTITDNSSGGTTTTLTVDQSTTTEFDGVIADGANEQLALNLTGPGELTLTGNYTFSQGISISSGTLDLESPLSGPLSISGGAQVVGTYAPVTGLPTGSISIGSPITLQSTATSVGGQTVAYAWTLSDAYGDQLDSGTDSNYTFTPTDSGIYTISLINTIDFEDNPQVNVAVNVQDIPPTTSVTGPTTGVEGTPIDLTASALDAGAVDQIMGDTFDWSVTQNGQSYATGQGSDINFTPDDSGSYVVTVTATDAEGTTSAPVTQTIAVSSVAPTATIANSGPVFEGSPFSVSLSNASDASYVAMLAGLKYSFAESESALATDYDSAGTQSTADFTFTTPGDYTVYGRVLDSHGYSTYSTTVSVVQPQFSDVQVTSGQEGSISTISGTIDNPQNSPLTLTVNWGGSLESFTAQPLATTFQYSHYSASYGNSTVSLIGSDGATTLAAATSSVDAAVPDVQITQTTASPDGQHFYLEADVPNLTATQNLSFAWTETDIRTDTTVATGSGQTFDCAIPQGSTDQYQVAVTATEGGPGAPSGTPVNGAQTATAIATLPSAGQSSATFNIPLSNEFPTITISETDPGEQVNAGQVAHFDLTLSHTVGFDVIAIVKLQSVSGKGAAAYNGANTTSLVTIPAYSTDADFNVSTNTFSDTSLVVFSATVVGGLFGKAAPIFDSANVSVVPPPTLTGSPSYMTLAGLPLVVPSPGLLADATDVLGRELQVQVTNQPGNGSLSLYNPTSEYQEGGFTYTPNSGFSGTDTFKYAAATQYASPAQVSTPASTATVQVATIGLTALSFGGPGNFIIQSDPDSDGTTFPYSSPQWDSPVAIIGTGTPRMYPVGYTMGTTLEVSASFHLSQAWTGSQIYISAVSSNGIQLNWAEALAAGENASATLTASSAFTAVNDLNCTFTWYASLVDPATGNPSASEIDIGTTTNEIYVTLSHPPASVRPFETSVFIGSNRSIGDTTQAQVFSNIWTQFADDSVYKKNATVPLTYYANYTPALVVATPDSIINLLATGDARCGVWALFMKDVLAAQGLNGDVLVVNPNPQPHQLILVNNWSFVGTGNATNEIDWSKYTVPGTETLTPQGNDIKTLIASHPYIDVFGANAKPNIPINKLNNTSYDFAPGGDVQDLDGIVGQGGVENPASIFDNHALVQYDGQWYDPSYGTVYDSATADCVSQTSIAGLGQVETLYIKAPFVNVVVPAGQSSVAVQVLLIAKNPKVPTSPMVTVNATPI